MVVYSLRFPVLDYHSGANDIGKFFMLIIPISTDLLIQVGELIPCTVSFKKCMRSQSTQIPRVSQKYGFEKTAAGAMQFSAELQRYQDDPEIRRAHDNLKRSFMPAALLEPSTSAPADDAME